METKNKTCSDCFYRGLKRGRVDNATIHKCLFFYLNIRSTTAACENYKDTHETYYATTVVTNY